jgi:hypothetical protein
MSGLAERTEKCPFCKRADIHYIYNPSSVRFKKGTYGGSKKGIIRTQESIKVIDDKCPNCGKTASEIEKNLKGEIEVPHEERIKRLQGAGLPTVFEDKAIRREEE